VRAVKRLIYFQGQIDSPSTSTSMDGSSLVYHFARYGLYEHHSTCMIHLKPPLPQNSLCPQTITHCSAISLHLKHCPLPEISNGLSASSIKHQASSSQSSSTNPCGIASPCSLRHSQYFLPTKCEQPHSKVCTIGRHILNCFFVLYVWVGLL
jgi:hypothetical protein